MIRSLTLHARIGVAAFIALLMTCVVARAGTYNLSIGEIPMTVMGQHKTALAINGSIPGPTLNFTEGETVTINVTNHLKEDTSLHWHGMVLPASQDGVPGISFDGIKPGETFTYSFPVKQSGTYWYHSHSGMQEQEGVYGAIIIKPKAREPFKFDRDYVVMLSEMHPSSPMRVLSNLKMMSDFYNNTQRTVSDFFADIADKGLGTTLSERGMWGNMRMMPTDIADVSGYAYLINGKTADENWTGLFRPGERIRLRFINGSAMTFFDVRIPGLSMLVVQADGNNVQPVKVDEFRIGVAETYDVIIQPRDEKALTIFAETMSRRGYARATLAPREGMSGAIPERREPPRLTMADMSMEMPGMDHGTMEHASMGHASMDHGAMAGMDMSGMETGKTADPFYRPGSGLAPEAADGGRFLSYADLKAQKPLYALRPAMREIELRLTGNMERYFWTINGVKYADAEPIRLRYGERVRFKFVNETMMTHPMHLHGMWLMLDNGNGKWNPIKHVVNIAPGMTVYTETEVDAPGEWAFHCHLMYHMATGMFRKIIVEGGPQRSASIAADHEVTR
ncbi:MAG: copper resistance system multicopper oxidase [Rhizobiales bacterium]|nr:copper resistance system multicopper oxidase [Hyphomicrobiales bacterium]